MNTENKLRCAENALRSIALANAIAAELFQISGISANITMGTNGISVLVHSLTDSTGVQIPSLDLTAFPEILRIVRKYNPDATVLHGNKSLDGWLVGSIFQWAEFTASEAAYNALVVAGKE